MHIENRRSKLSLADKYNVVLSVTWILDGALTSARF